MRHAGEVYIYGAGGHGKVVASVALSRKIKVAGFLEDDVEKVGKKVLGIRIMGGMAFLEGRLAKKGRVSVLVAIGENKARKDVYQRLKQMKAVMLAVSHSSSVIHESVKIGEGTVAMPGVIVNAGSSIGENVILNTGVSVDHDCAIGSHVHLGPGVTLCGNVHVGEGALLGVGVSVIPGVKIGAHAIVGAGSVVISDVRSGEKVVGVPAQTL